jgi:hypothetical protein
MILILDSLIAKERLYELLQAGNYSTSKPLVAVDYMRFAKPIMATGRLIETDEYLMTGSIGDVFRSNLDYADYRLFKSIKDTLKEGENTEEYGLKAYRWIRHIFESFGDTCNMLIYNCALKEDNEYLQSKFSGATMRHIWINTQETDILYKQYEDLEFKEKTETTRCIEKEHFLPDPVSVGRWISERTDEPVSKNLHNRLMVLCN